MARRRGDVDIPGETTELEAMMAEWDSQRVTEVYRRTRFSAQHDAVIARWCLRAPHDEHERHFVEHRVSRAQRALAELSELEDQSESSFLTCRGRLDALAGLSPRDQAKTLTQVREVGSRALRENMRYRSAVLTALGNEVRELEVFLEERFQ